ncbi:hypothetical protein FPJ26_12830 [Salmonella enterica]|nr:hypothetical protein [Salmonella enterica]
MISFRDFSAYLLPSASVLLRFLAGSRAKALSPDCGEHCRRSIQLSPDLRNGENKISVSCSRLQYSLRRSSSSSRLFS